mmetsp:Transcript_61877/g.96093  ORF Transcript_61877/g.96093 Transcript_61877/m.96093 type:complete len:214 (+) Transcript_61877:1074-1715(+)
MLPCLTTSFETSLELALPCRNDQDANICLRSSRNHVGHIGFVAWSIKDCESSVRGLEMCTANFDRFSFGFFFFVGVHNVSKEPTFSILVFSLLHVFFNTSFIHTAAQEENVPACCGFPCIYMANENNVQVWSRIRLFGFAFLDGAAFLYNFILLLLLLFSSWWWFLRCLNHFLRLDWLWRWFGFFLWGFFLWLLYRLWSRWRLLFFLLDWWRW